MANNPYSSPKRNYIPFAVTAVVAGALGFGLASFLTPAAAPSYTADYSTAPVAQQGDEFSKLLAQANATLSAGRTEEAKAQLLELSQRYPKRPEPLNNLATIAANAADYDLAISYLLQAINGHPSYQTLYNNLKELHSAQAALAYSKALGLSADHQSPQLAVLGNDALPAAVQEPVIAALAVAQVDEPLPAPQPAEVTPQAPEPEVIASAQVIEQSDERVTLALNLPVAAEPPAPPAITEADDVIIQAPAGNSELPTEAPLDLAQFDARDDLESGYTNVRIDPNDSRTIASLDNTGADREAQLGFDQASVEAQLEQEDLALAVTSEQVEAETARAEALLAAIEQDTSIVEPSPSLSFDPSDLNEQVIARVNAWANAWQNQRVNDYIASYIVGFRPADGRSYESWKALRENRITRPDFIEINLSDMQINAISDTEVVVTFVQDYRANNYQDSERKQLTLMLRSGGWKITSETNL